jgi:transposase
MSRLRFVGLDVHAESITIAVAEANGEVRCLGKVANREECIGKVIKKLGAVEHLRCCYEAGPTGYVLYWQLTGMGVECAVIAPSLVPSKPGDRVKTDRRDAEKLARSHRAGDLTAVWVPDSEHEALRDLVRAREAAKKDQTRARHRLSKFLLRHGRRAPAGVRAWTQKHWQWVQSEVQFVPLAQQVVLVDYRHEVEHCGARLQRLEKAIQEAVQAAPAAMRAVMESLQSLRGVGEITAATIVSEVGQLSRFATARQLMGYSGAVARENSSGERVRQGGITKTGNAHLRRVVVEAAWAYRHGPAIGSTLRKRQEKVSAEVIEMAWKAQHRLHRRYRKLIGRGKNQQQTIVALARELLGFIWAIGVQVEAKVQAWPAAPVLPQTGT